MSAEAEVVSLRPPDRRWLHVIDQTEHLYQQLRRAGWSEQRAVRHVTAQVIDAFLETYTP